MEPVVNRLKKDYRNCITLERVNFHAPDLVERNDRTNGFAGICLLDSSGKILYRWFGVVERSEFDDVMILVRPVISRTL